MKVRVFEGLRADEDAVVLKLTTVAHVVTALTLLDHRHGRSFDGDPSGLPRMVVTHRGVRREVVIGPHGYHRIQGSSVRPLGPHDPTSAGYTSAVDRVAAVILGR